MAVARDNAMQRLRDLTIAVAVASAGAVGLFAWLSAVTIPGGSGAPTAAATDNSGDPTYSSDQGLVPTDVRSAPFGSGVAVSGGSR